MAQRRRVQAGTPTRIPHQPSGSGSPVLSLTSITIGAPWAVATHTQPEVGFLSAPVFQESCD